MLTPNQLRIRQLNRRTYLSVATVILTVVAFFAIKAFVERPTDLGPKLEYIGTNYNSGCTLFFCDSPATTRYYFATDMSIEQMSTYFKNFKATSFNQSGSIDDSNYPLYTEIGYDPISRVSQQGFTADYYQDGGPVRKLYRLQSSRMKSIVSMDSYSYDQAKLIYR